MRKGKNILKKIVNKYPIYILISLISILAISIFNEINNARFAYSNFDDFSTDLLKGYGHHVNGLGLEGYYTRSLRNHYPGPYYIWLLNFSYKIHQFLNISYATAGYLTLFSTYLIIIILSTYLLRKYSMIKFFSPLFLIFLIVFQTNISGVRQVTAPTILGILWGPYLNNAVLILLVVTFILTLLIDNKNIMLLSIALSVILSSLYLPYFIISAPIFLINIYKLIYRKKKDKSKGDKKENILEILKLNLAFSPLYILILRAIKEGPLFWMPKNKNIDMAYLHPSKSDVLQAGDPGWHPSQGFRAFHSHLLELPTPLPYLITIILMGTLLYFIKTKYHKNVSIYLLTYLIIGLFQEFLLYPAFLNAYQTAYIEIYYVITISFILSYTLERINKKSILSDKLFKRYITEKGVLTLVMVVMGLLLISTPNRYINVRNALATQPEFPINFDKFKVDNKIDKRNTIPIYYDEKIAKDEDHEVFATSALALLENGVSICYEGNRNDLKDIRCDKIKENLNREISQNQKIFLSTIKIFPSQDKIFDPRRDSMSYPEPEVECETPFNMSKCYQLLLRSNWFFPKKLSEPLFVPKEIYLYLEVDKKEK